MPADVSDLMRRMVKENLLKFDATPLFPERIAYTVPYKLSDAEARSTRRSPNMSARSSIAPRRLENDKRAGTVGFALTILQRRLASSPEAIYQSLRRRRERLESRLRELEMLQRGGQVAQRRSLRRPGCSTRKMSRIWKTRRTPKWRPPRSRSSTRQRPRARSRNCSIEIETLKALEALALAVRRSGDDKKWRELATPARRDLHPGRDRQRLRRRPRAV